MKPVQRFKELHIYFQDMDHMDVKAIAADVSLRCFIAGMLSYYPWWILVLYRIRELLVGLLGLVKHEKPERLSTIEPESIAFESGERVSFFIVRNAREDLYWVAETPQDKHLQAYFGVVAERMDDGRTKFHVFTSVKYKHWTGPLYFNLIRPFHHLVVWRMMKAGIGVQRKTKRAGSNL
jgi:hypothetical protein